ncbi:hypothetical protein AFK24_15615 [Pseudomonas syringae]|uniref:Uncharacterized protein n=1 Tax=Pseudomonas syringae TaxID=317 RepID=A0A1C7Z4U5_PSESX|nr:MULTISPECIES: hypothetical protein [Pseudomonas]MDR6929355.1 hypothetical protein [Pseudomonas sp. BE134]OCR24180.1 hypothetical protein AFK24_15615 [Pseudomonas syringae]
MDTNTRIRIDRLSISGVDAATARALGAAIERALGKAALAGRLNPYEQRTLRLNLKAGADARAIARALADALGER